ncbi:YkgJ family cysteine cluster protein [bacterium]|jgi:Fe-S-cluster containining protein|nr:YkgJ family cysteine cluster protein [bacterium]
MECNMCGDCCRLFLINLTESEYRSKMYKTIFQNYGFINNFEEATEIGANFLAQNMDTSCIYLKNNKCSIHSKRPQVCRTFCCNSKDSQFKEMLEDIEEWRVNRI